MRRRDLLYGCLSITCSCAASRLTLAQVPSFDGVRVLKSVFSCGIGPLRTAQGFSFDEKLTASRSGVDALDQHIDEEIKALNTFFALSERSQPTFSFYHDDERPISARSLRIPGQGNSRSTRLVSCCRGDGTQPLVLAIKHHRHVGSRVGPCVAVPSWAR